MKGLGNSVHTGSTSSNISQFFRKLCFCGRVIDTLGEILFSSIRLMLFLTFVNLIIYFDRGAIAAVLPKIATQYNISSTQEGIIASFFMIGYMCTCPIFAELASRITRVNLILAFGLFIWSIAAILQGFSDFFTNESWGYYMLVACRCFIGIGEAAFLSISPSIIDDIAPVKSRTIFMSLYFVAIPVGASLGYAIAGFLAVFVSWRAPFWLEGAIMILCTIVTLFIPSTYKTKMKFGVNYTEESQDVKIQKAALYTEATIKLFEIKQDTIKEEIRRRSSMDASRALENLETFDDEEEEEEDALQLHRHPSSEHSSLLSSNTPHRTPPKKYNLFSALLKLICNPIYVMTVLGAAAYTAVVGSLSFFAPKYITKVYDIPLYYSSLSFSIIAVITGIVGTALGGIINDKIGGSIPKKGIGRSLFLSFACMIIAFPVGMIAWFMENIYVFAVLVFTAELFIFMLTSPINCALLSMVENNLRTYATSVYIFCIHLIGDFPSPILFGLIEDYIGKIQDAMILLWCLLIFTVVLYFFAWIIARRKYLTFKRVTTTQQQQQQSNGNFDFSQTTAAAAAAAATNTKL